MGKNKIQDELLNHEIDGIREFDNDLPPWWVYMFYITIVYSVIYVAYYHVTGKGPSQDAEYQAAVEEAKLVYKGSGDYDTANWVIFTDNDSLKKGASLYDENCMVCHGMKAEGLVGPNLTDEYWIRGPKFADIANTIIRGVPDKGMVPWEGKITPEEVRLLASYVVSLQGTNPEGAKEPQGEKFDASLIGK